MINFKTEQLKNDIIMLISQANLPAVNVYYVMKELTAEVSLAHQKALAKELEQASEQEETKTED